MLLVTFLLLLGLVSSIPAQPQNTQFVPGVTVELVSGERVELARCKFHSHIAELEGKGSALGIVGRFSIRLFQMRTIAALPDRQGGYAVTDENGATTVISDPSIAEYAPSGPGRVAKASWGFDEEIEITVGRTIVRVRPRLIESIVFPKNNATESQLTIRMKNGDQATGTFVNVSFISGNADSGAFMVIPFAQGQEYTVRSIRFH
jgi:hypothetical protein